MFFFPSSLLLGNFPFLVASIRLSISSYISVLLVKSLWCWKHFVGGNGVSKDAFADGDDLSRPLLSCKTQNNKDTRKKEVHRKEKEGIAVRYLC